MKSTITTIILALIFINVYAQAPNWVWAKRAGGTEADAANGITSDASGNVYVIGEYKLQTITFGSFTLNNTDATGNTRDLFIVKYDASGNVIWAKGEGGDNVDIGYAITTDASGNVYVTGQFGSSTITFGTTTLINTGSYDIFVAKYDASGNFIWAKGFGGLDTETVTGITTDASGNVCLTGSYNSTSITFGVTTLTNAGGGNQDMYIVKYDASGNVIWAKGAGGVAFDGGLSVAVDVSGNIYLTGGYSSDSISFGAFTLTNTNIPGSSSDIFTVKYNALGNVIWARSEGGTGNETPLYIVSDAFGNLYVTGKYYSPFITFGATTLNNAGVSNADIFILKYDASGTLLWAKGEGGTGDEESRRAYVDINGNLYITGYYDSPSITFGATALNSSGGRNIFVVKYDTLGTALWAKQAGEVWNGGCWGITADAAGYLYIAGSFSSTFMLFGTINLANAYSGYLDMFIAKLGTTLVGSEKNTEYNEISIYPNPSSDIFTVQVSDLKLQNCAIYNLLGECVYTQKSNLSNQINIDLSAQPKGIYFIEITDINNNYFNKKIIIE